MQSHVYPPAACCASASWNAPLRRAATNSRCRRRRAGRSRHAPRLPAREPRPHPLPALMQVLMLPYGPRPAPAAAAPAAALLPYAALPARRGGLPSADSSPHRLARLAPAHHVGSSDAGGRRQQRCRREERTRIPAVAASSPLCCSAAASAAACRRFARGSQRPGTANGASAAAL